MFSGLNNDEVFENVFWPELPYLTDEHGNIYFRVNDDEDIMQTLTSDNNNMQVIISLDAKGMLNEMDLSGPSTMDFGVEEIEAEESDFDDEDEDEDEDDSDADEDGDEKFEGGWIEILDDEEDFADSDGSLGDWAKLETIRSSHPMYFAKKISEVASDKPIDCMEQQPAGIAVQGLLRPAFIEEQYVIQKYRSSLREKNTDIIKGAEAKEDKAEDAGEINGHAHMSGSSESNSVLDEDLDQDNDLANGTAFYKLEMAKIQLISAHGNQITVDMEDYRNACPDAIAHSSAKIISRVNAAGEKTADALKSLCWRSKHLEVRRHHLLV